MIEVAGEKEVGTIIQISEERILAAMELAGILQPVDENLTQAMDGLREQMAPEEVDQRKKTIMDAIEKGRHEIISKLDPDLLVLLARSAIGEVCFIKSNQTRH